jgi:hypothetical protein
MTCFLTVLLQPADQLAAAQQGIGPYALIFMLVSMGGVTLLAGWCFWRIVRGRRHFDPDGTGPAHSPVPGRLDLPGETPPR